MLVDSEIKLPALELTGVDLLCESWSDYVMVYDYVIDQDELCQSLKKALNRNPYFGGRKLCGADGKGYISSDGGASIEFHHENTELPDDYVEFDQDDDHLFCDRSNRKKHRASRTSLKVALFQIKVTTFKNATVMGFSVWHSLADGTTFFDFINAWTSIHRDVEVPDINFDRIERDLTHVDSDFSNSLKKISFYTDKEKKIKPMQEQTFVLTSTQQKQIFALNNPHQTVMNVDILPAFVWKLILGSLSASNMLTASLYSVYDVRPLVGVCDNYVGNLLYYPNVTVNRSEVDNLSVESIAESIRESAYELLDEADFILDEIVWLSKHVTSLNKSQFIHGTLGSAIYEDAVIYNNLSSLPLSRMDFGNGAPSYIDCPLAEDVKDARFITVFSLPSNENDLMVKVNLTVEEMKIFEKSYHAYIQDLCQEVEPCI
ncbi:MAG: hypothetical protein HRU25_01360 [Psychrobium sp.]|nr:hypothetical protein [Psychrobium sp.]